MKTVVLLISALLFAPHTFSATDLDPIEVNTEKPTQYSTILPTKTTEMLEEIPGVSLQSAGGISALPMIHGMASDRVNIKIDQAQITSSCPNHMNPALSYIDPHKIESIKTLAGITPVGDGGDSIGGTIVVKSKAPEFSKEEGKFSKKLNLTTFFKSNNESQGASLLMSVANQKISFQYSGMDEHANNYRTGKGDRLKGTLYNQNNQSMTLGRKLNNDGIVSLKLSRAVVPYQGFVNQYMDMVDNVSNAANLRYEGNFGEAFIESSVYYQHTNHLMDKLKSERDGDMPMYTRSDELGYNVKATFTKSMTTYRVGSDFNRYRLNDWWPPVADSMMMEPNNFLSINNGMRDRLGLFAEVNSQWSDDVSTNLGVRTDIVSMNTGSVHGYNETNNLPVDAADFNSKSRTKHDRNYDVTLMTDIRLSEKSDFEIGFARKTRSPNLYERYAWAGTVTDPDGSMASMDARMINWFGDANGYVGNIDLKPEVAHTLSTSIIFHDETSKNWDVKFTPYYTQVENFIDTDLISTSAGDGVNFLRFANHDAVIFGADLSANTSLYRSSTLGNFFLKGLASYTRGYRKDGMTNLYNLKPLNGTLSLLHEAGKWNSNISVNMVKSKDQVNSLRREKEIAGYALVDLGTNYQLSKTIKINLAVTNLLDHEYNLPLGGVDLVNFEASDHKAVFAMGRSINSSVSFDY